MLERLQIALDRVRTEGRIGVVPYVTVGFPSIEETMAIVPAIERAGADAIELGVPYSDPLADGPDGSGSELPRAAGRREQAASAWTWCGGCARRV